MTMRRSGIRVVLTRDGAPVAWRVVARDGADLPAAQRVTGPGGQLLSIGQTVDVEVTPDAPGDMRLEVRMGPQPNARLLGVQPLRVRADPPAR